MMEEKEGFRVGDPRQKINEREKKKKKKDGAAPLPTSGGRLGQKADTTTTALRRYLGAELSGSEQPNVQRLIAPRFPIFSYPS